MEITFPSSVDSPPQDWVDDLPEIRFPAVIGEDTLHPIVCIIPHDLLAGFFGKGRWAEVFEAHRNEIEKVFTRRIEAGPIPSNCEIRVCAEDVLAVRRPL